MAEKDNKKKQVPLRLSAKLYDAIAAWAEDDFRSVNGQIEYLLTECVRQRKKNGKYVSEHLDEPIDLDISYSLKKTAADVIITTSVAVSLCSILCNHFCIFLQNAPQILYKMGNTNADIPPRDSLPYVYIPIFSFHLA